MIAADRGWRRRLPTAVPAEPGPARGRPDPRGLSAIAVTGVILTGLLHRPVGGLIGVDVAFVVVGYLITAWALDQWRASGRVPVARCYVASAKRIFPATTLVLAVTVLAATVAAPAAVAAAVRGDAIRALLMVTNGHPPPSGVGHPLQNFWAVSVSAQFLLVWPLALVAVTWVVRRLGGSRRTQLRVTATVILALGLASFAYAHHQGPGAAFASPARLWEFATGALVAACAAAAARLPRSLRPVLRVVGVLGIVLAMVLLPAAGGVSAPQLLLPVGATAVAVAAGIGARPGPVRAGFVRSLPPRAIRYVGDLAFSLYLWQLPVIVIIGYVASGPQRIVETLVVLVALSVATHHGVELPLSRAPLFEPIQDWHSRAHRWEDWRSDTRRAAGPAVVALLAVITVVELQLTAPASIDASRPAPASTAAASGPSANATQAATTPQQALAAKVVDALTVGTFSGVSPTPAALSLSSLQAPWRPDGCTDVTQAAQIARCASGPTGSASVLIVGDSVATAWLPGLRAAFPGRRILQITKTDCPAWNVPVRLDGRPDTACDQQHAWVATYLRANRHTVVILATGAYLAGDLSSGSTSTGALAEIQDGLQRTIVMAKSSGAKVYVLGSPPGAQPWIECYRPAAAPRACWGPTMTTTNDLARTASMAAAQATGVTYVDVDPWFCADGHCPASVGSLPVYADGRHLTTQYARSLADVLRAAIS